MRQRLTKFFGYVLDYGPIVVTVLSATSVALLATQITVQTETTQLLQWVLLILVLLSTTQLIDRVRLLRGVDQKLDRMLESSKAESGVDMLFLDQKPPLADRLRQAKTIDHNGITLVGTSNNLAPFTDCVARGGRIRLIMVDPQDKALEVAAQRFLKHQNPTMFRTEAEHALDNFSSVYREPKAKTGFKIGLAHIVPPYSIWLIDANTPQAEIWIGLYSFRDNIEPWFQLLPYKDERGFKFFQKQFDLMWQASRQWIPTDEDTIEPKI